MRFLSFRVGREERYGAIIEDRVVDLAERMPEYPTLRHVLEAGALVRAQDVSVSASADYEQGEIDWLPPLPNPRKIVCIGINYPDRRPRQPADGRDARYPSVFLRTRESLVGHRQPLLKPPETGQLDYAGEIALVIGREGRRIPEHKALEHVAGLTVMNEGAARDWMRHGEFHVTQGKNFEGTGAVGPWLVTRDECPPLDALTLTTHVNGELRQQASSRDLRFGFAFLVSYLSTFMRLTPGDLIATGTPGGTGEEREPATFLEPGDEVVVAIDGVGTLSNEVVAEEAPAARS
jgi:2-keto-4-pentenoate hydratase/2-oxohepta-3-ene-1,7-dioic acid hydratase in catechol pathway